MIQPTQINRRILPPARPGYIWFSLGLALLLNLMPFSGMVLLPDWLALVLMFWCIHQPQRIGLGVAFLFGLLMDVGDGSILGQHALAYALLAFAAIALARRILWFRLGQQALHILPLLLMVKLVMVVTRLIGGGEFPGLSYFSGAFTAALLWPVLTYLLLLPQYRAVERDETRPI